jgi:transcriptional regulator with XRE-family HTH domain
MSNEYRPGHRVKELRQKAGLSGYEMASRLGFTQSNFSKLENCKISVNLDVLYKIADILDVRPKDLLDGADKQSALSIEYEDEVVNVRATLVVAKDVERLISLLDQVRERMSIDEAASKDKVVSLRSVPPKAENGGN